MKKFDRRSFLKTSSLSAAAIASTSLLSSCVEPKVASKGIYMGGFVAPKIDYLRAAFIGVGARGGNHLRVVASMENTEVVAVCDLYEDHVNRWTKIASDIGKGERHQKVAAYFGDENLWEKMLEEVKPDVVFIATNWDNHAPMVIEAMKKGAHAFVEVPIATTLEDMWEIVRTSEETQNSGHGGMDGIMVYRIVECLQQGLPLDQNVYEGCFWSSVSPLSGASIAQDGAPQQFPDFTAGRWKETPPLQIIS